MNHFSWASPTTIPEATSAASAIVAEAMTAPGGSTTGVVKAGGIDLLDLMKEGMLAPDTLVNLATVSGLDGIAEEKDGLRIGAMVTLAHLAAHPLIRQRYPALAEAVGASASPQIRNVATLGGNLLQRPRCWYFRAKDFHCLRKGGGHCFALTGENQYHAIFDNQSCAIVHPSTAATVLVALGAQVELVNANGVSRTPLLEEFFIPPERDLQRENDLHPHEILTAIHLPALAGSLRMAHLKQGEKDSFDWPLADVAVVLDMAAEGRCIHAAVVLGAAAPVPHRASAAEYLLIGQHIDAVLAARASKAALEGARPLGKNAYKLPLFETLIRRAVLKAANA
ncbi:MAG: FAD binding domain-containing protein [Alphaproteobacteria bacterium]|nr:FAD binding domain-containing protein [Alphaproteobacteria bacterium]